MDLVQLIVLALVQGLTEFLPISSSAHLILVPALLGWEDQGLAFDVAVHVGTLVAVVAYFRRDLRAMTEAWFRSLRGQHSLDSRLAWFVLLATIPAGLVGLFLGDFIETALRAPWIIAATTISFGLLLWAGEHWGSKSRDVANMTWKDALLIGLAQAIALIPGTSRSGVTITAGMMLGMTADVAARFSFLLSIPLITAAGLLKGGELISTGQTGALWPLVTAAALAAFSAYLSIHFFLQLLKRIGMLPFVIYRLGLGVLLLVMFPIS